MRKYNPLLLAGAGLVAAAALLAAMATTAVAQQPRKVDDAAWTARAVKLSVLFGSVPEVIASGVDLQILDGNYVYETVSAGGIVGEMAMVDGSPRSATVCAIKPSTVIPIDERRFLFMVQQTPFFALRVMRVMTARLRAMNERGKAPG